MTIKKTVMKHITRVASACERLENDAIYLVYESGAKISLVYCEAGTTEHYYIFTTQKIKK